MKCVLVLTPHPPFADDVRAVAEPIGFRVVHRLTLEDAEPLLVHGLVSACLLDLSHSDIHAVWAIERIRAWDAHCAVLVYTDQRDQESEEQLLMAGGRHVFEKPLRPKLLEQALRSIKQAPATRLPSPRGGLIPSAPQPPVPGAAADQRRIEASGLGVLRRFSEILTHSLDESALIRESLHLLREILGVNRAAVFLRDGVPDPEEAVDESVPGTMRPVCAVGIRAALVREVSLSSETGIGACLSGTGRILRRTSAEAAVLDVRREFEQLGVEVAIPIAARGEMVGVALFDHRVTGAPLSDGELESVFHLLEQVGMAVGNIERHQTVVGSNRLLGDVLRALDTACLVVDSKLTVRHANKAARRAIQATGDGAGTIHFGELPEELGAKVYQVIHTGAAVTPFRYTPPDARGLIYSVSVVPVRGSDAGEGDGSIVLLVMDDRTQAEQLQRLEVEAANLRLVNNMADRLAAEIGNAVVPLSVHHQLFDQRYKEAEFRKSLKTAMGEGVRRVDRLASQMRFIYGNANKDPQDHSLGELLDEAAEVARTCFSGKTARFDVDDRLRKVVVRGTLGALKHAFAEVILNGFQARTGAAKVQVGRIDLKGADGAGEVGIEFVDAGEGFSEEAVMKATEPFYTRKTVGVGLGLTAVKKIVDDHAGRLEIPRGQGAEGGLVRIFLPVAAVRE